PRVRLTTNLQIYFDRIFVALDDDPDAIARTTHELPPISATLHYRGYSARPFPDGKEPFVYDYEHLVPDATGYPIEYSRFAGAFTRYGDVMPLVTATDDMSVIMDNGDEIALSFDATKLPPLAPGMTRTWLLHSIGWAKDGDFHTLTSDTVMPLPFAAMTKYPYGQDGSGEKFPDDEAHRRWQAEWNTRLQTASPLVDAPRRAPPPMPSECDPADRMTFTDVTTAAGIDFHHSQGSVLVNLEDTMGAGCAFGDFDGDGDDDLYFVQGTGPTSRFAPGGAGDVGDARFLGKLYRNDGGCRFTDVTAAAGLLREGFGMGALFADLDNDGDEDLYVTNLGGNVLWRNDGGRFTDVTAQAGVAGGGFGSGIAAGDFDKDGDLDLCVGQYVEIDPKKRPQESPGFARGFVRDDPPSVLPYVYPAQRKFLFQNDGGLRFTDVA
ncbi:MAG TPA: VCBS repeat-containing protein, partial [Pirellulaceae bacterium]|nr:VCBS repeat-containing protein [Pirellulaceae bacterium]